MKKKEVNSARIPVYRDAGFELYNAEITSETFGKEHDPEREPDNYIYSRYRNPTVVSAEEEIMKAEGSSWALLAQTGMAAIDIALSIFHKGKETGPWLFFTEIYGGTISYIDEVLIARRNIDVRYFMPDGSRYDFDKLEKTISGMKPTIVYIETISNPTIIVADITEAIRIAKKHSCTVIVDNTFATPMLYRPLDHGADIVIHSATKYFSGHGNLTAGVLCGNDPKIMKVALDYRRFVGHMISPDDAYRLQTQIQTFSLRFQRQCENAAKIASFLERSEKVKRIWYPGLEKHPTHDVAKKLFGEKGFGAMITFDLDGSTPADKRKKRDDFIDIVSDKIKLIPSLGDFHTILMPVEAVWGAKYPEPGMIRLSVGFEDYGEIEEVIMKAIDSI